MKKEALSHFAQPDLILFSFLLFFVSFIGVCIWVNLRSRREIYKALEMLPLDREESAGKL
jgi:hypothetical protein